jgi:tetratricopeptide (TPR) repeat protein
MSASALALLFFFPTTTVASSARSKRGDPPSRTATAHPLADLLAQGKHKEGLDWLASFGKGTPEEARYRGLFNHGLGRPDETLRDLVPVYRAQPKDDAVALAVAEASLWKKDYKTATSVLGGLQAPDEPDALRVRGMLFEQAGRLPEAVELYDRAIPRLRAPWEVMERRAQVLSWMKRFDDARVAFTQIADDPRAELALRRRSRVRLAELSAWNKDLDGALAQVTALLREAPGQIDALLLEGQVLEWQGRFGEAKQVYSRILAADGGNAPARLRLNKLLWVK